MFTKPGCIFFLGICLVSGCSYHGRIHRSIYKTAHEAQRVAPSVLVLTDQSIPAEVTILEYNTKGTSAHGFYFRTLDGVAVAATDALAELFQRAEAGPSSLQDNYAFTAEVSYEALLTRTNCETDLADLAVRREGVCTVVEVKIRRSGQEPVLARAAAKRWEDFTQPDFATTLKSSLPLLSPVLMPVYMQSKGASLRRQLERNLRQCLQRIVEDLRNQQENISLPAQNK